MDLGASNSANAGQFIGAQRQNQRIAVEIKDLRGKSPINNLEQAIGQYVLYDLLLKQVDRGREVYLAVSDIVYDEIFDEPIGELVITELPMRLLVINLEKIEVKEWIRTNTARQ